MNALDQIIADAIAGSQETHVAMLAREVVRLREAAAVVVPPDSPSKYRWRSVLDMIPKDVWLICIDTDARIFYAKQGPRSGGWTFHGAHAFRDPTHWLDVIPENRLLRDGMVAVDAEELRALERVRMEAEYAKDAFQQMGEFSQMEGVMRALHELDALRTHQEGVNHD